MESIISLVTNSLVTTTLLLALLLVLALLAKKYRHLLREMVLRETKKGHLLREVLREMVLREKKAISVRTSLRTCSLRTKTCFRCVHYCVHFLAY